MSCASCVNRVDQALRKAPGVREAHVNLALRQARVVLDDVGLLAPVLAAVQKAGYRVPASVEALRAGLTAKQAEDAQDAEARSLAVRTGAALALAALTMALPMTHVLSASALRWTLLSLTVPVVAWAGRSFFARAWARYVTAART